MEILHSQIRHAVGHNKNMIVTCTGMVSCAYSNREAFKELLAHPLVLSTSFPAAANGTSVAGTANGPGTGGDDSSQQGNGGCNITGTCTYLAIKF